MSTPFNPNNKGPVTPPLAMAQDVTGSAQRVGRTGPATGVGPGPAPGSVTVTKDQADQFLDQLREQDLSLTHRIMAGQTIKHQLAVTDPQADPESSMDAQSAAILFLLSEAVDRLISAREQNAAQIAVVEQALTQHGQMVYPATALPNVPRRDRNR